MHHGTWHRRGLRRPVAARKLSAPGGRSPGSPALRRRRRSGSRRRTASTSQCRSVSTGSRAWATSAGRSSWANRPAPSMTSSGRWRRWRPSPAPTRAGRTGPDRPRRAGRERRSGDARRRGRGRSRTSKLRSTRTAASRCVGDSWSGWRKNSSNSPSSSDESAKASPRTNRLRRSRGWPTTQPRPAPKPGTWRAARNGLNRQLRPQAARC